MDLPSGSATRHFLYSPELNLIAETTLAESSQTPTVGHEYIWFAGLPVAQIEVASGSTHWIFTDHLGTPILQTNAAGVIDWRAELEPYGEVLTLRATTDRHQPLRLPGQEAEQFDVGANGATQRSYNIFRWYRAGWGRYTQSDPILSNDAVSWDTPDPYDYSGDNPVDHFDELGLYRKCMRPSSYQNIGPLALLHHQPFYKPSWLFNLFWYDAKCGGQCCDEKLTDPQAVPDPAFAGSAAGSKMVSSAAPTVQFVKWKQAPCHAEIGVSTRTAFSLVFGMANFKQFGQQIQLCFECTK